VSCDACEDIRRKDEREPDCETGKGCRIPSLLPGPARALRLRRQVLRLGGLIPPAEVLKMHGATLRDVEMIAVAEDIYREMAEEEAERKGNEQQDSVHH